MKTTALLLAATFAAAAAVAQDAVIIDRSSVKYVDLATGAVASELHADGIVAAAQPLMRRIFVLKAHDHDREAHVDIIRDGAIEKHVALDFHPSRLELDPTMQYAVVYGGDFGKKFGGMRRLAIDIHDLPQSDPAEEPILMRPAWPRPEEVSERRQKELDTGMKVSENVASVGSTIGSPRSGAVAGIATFIAGALLTSHHSEPVTSRDSRYRANIADDDRVVFRDAATNKILLTVRKLEGRVFVGFVNRE